MRIKHLFLRDTTLNAKSFIGLVSFALLFHIYIWVTWYISFYPQSDKLETYGPILLATGQITKSSLEHFIVSDKNGAPRQTKWLTIAEPIFCFAIILLCSLAVIFRLWKHQKGFAAADRKIQNQITVVLFCEALVPLVTMVIPLQFLTFLHRVIPWFPPMLFYIIAFSPIFNPIVKMFVIAPFRKTIFGIFWKPKNSSVLFVSSVTGSSS